MRTPGFPAALSLFGLLTLAWPTPALAKPAAKSTHHTPPRCVTGETVDPRALPAEHHRRGQCDELDGQLVNALERYELALRQQPPALLARQLRARIGALIPRLGTLRLDASAWPAADTRVRIGTRVVETGAARRPFVDPGRVEIVVEAPGFEPGRQTVDVAIGRGRGDRCPPFQAIDHLYLGLQIDPFPGLGLIGGIHARRGETLAGGYKEGDRVPGGQVQTDKHWLGVDFERDYFVGLIFDAAVLLKLVTGLAR